MAQSSQQQQQQQQTEQKQEQEEGSQNDHIPPLEVAQPIQQNRPLPISALVETELNDLIYTQNDYLMRCYVNVLINYELDNNLMARILNNSKPNRWGIYQLRELGKILNPIRNIAAHPNNNKSKRMTHINESHHFTNIKKRSPELYSWIISNLDEDSMDDFIDSITDFNERLNEYKSDYLMARTRMIKQMENSMNNMNNINNNNMMDFCTPQNRTNYRNDRNVSSPHDLNALSPPTTTAKQIPPQLTHPYDASTPESSPKSSPKSKSNHTQKQTKSKPKPKEKTPQRKKADDRSKHKTMIRNWLSSLIIQQLWPNYWPQKIILISINQYAWLHYKDQILSKCRKTKTAKKRVENLDLNKIIQFAIVCKITFIIYQLYTHLYSIYIHIIYNQ